MFNIGDSVRIIGERATGKIVRIVDDIALVQYPDGRKKKIGVCNLFPPIEDSNNIELTPEKYDEAVKALMYTAAESAESDEQLNGILEVIGAICAQLKARLFDGN